MLDHLAAELLERETLTDAELAAALAGAGTVEEPREGTHLPQGFVP